MSSLPASTLNISPVEMKKGAGTGRAILQLSGIGLHRSYQAARSAGCDGFTTITTGAEPTMPDRREILDRVILRRLGQKIVKSVRRCRTEQQRIAIRRRRATSSEPIAPAAPGLFSATICWPRMLDTRRRILARKNIASARRAETA